MNHVFASFCTFCTITVKMPAHVSACEYFFQALHAKYPAMLYNTGDGGISLFVLLGCLQYCGAGF
jgi:hypothetical protein